jgi:hypothetical protein
MLILVTEAVFFAMIEKRSGLIFFKERGDPDVFRSGFDAED